MIRKTLSELHGPRLAFAAASAAWFMAIQYATEQSMKRVAKWRIASAPHSCDDLIAELDAEHEALLRGYHSELCAQLEVDPEEALELSKAFTQVVRDICLQGG